MKYFLALLISASLFSFNLSEKKTKTTEVTSDKNIIHFEKSEYGLIFTNISVNGKSVKAMIDFGDPNVLQLSSSFVKEEQIDVQKTNAIAKDVFGNSFEINKGVAKEIMIGQWKNNDVEFLSSPNEIESVSKQINTTFNAVVGWGYFNNYYTQIDYKASTFIVSKKHEFDDTIIFKTSFNKNSNYLSVPVSINDSTANLIIDTGSPISLIDSSYYHQRKFKDIVVKIEQKEVPLDLKTQDLRILKQINAHGIIGGDFLNKYKIIIDPFKKQLSFKR